MKDHRVVFFVPVVIILLAKESRGQDEEGNDVFVLTPLGRVRGVREGVLGKNISIFWGIPYARPPIGQLRFQRPRPAKSWQSTYDATKRPAACIQVHVRPIYRSDGMKPYLPNTGVSEDCLYVNVWAPSYNDGDPLKAVMVWIHGGSLEAGSASLELYDGSILTSENDVIVVSMQYRLSVLGFLHLDSRVTPGNVGMVDQQMALRWVQDNIASFGGDRARVTLFGSSSGALSISLHMLAPGSHALFSNAILQSGSVNVRAALKFRMKSERASPYMLLHEKRDATISAKLLTKFMNCYYGDVHINSSLQCLLAKNPLALEYEAKNLQVHFAPIVDGFFLREDPLMTLKHGRMKRTQLMVGSNKNEGTMTLAQIVPELRVEQVTPDDARKIHVYTLGYMLGNTTGYLVDAAETMYEINQVKEGGAQTIERLSTLVQDAFFLCPQMEFIESVVHYGDVYQYLFAHTSSQSLWPGWMGVVHGDEIYYVFGAPLNDSLAYTSKEKSLSREIMTFWSNFAKTGNPNRNSSDAEGDDDDLWTPVTHVTKCGIKKAGVAFRPKFLQLDISQSRMHEQQDDWGERCAFWRYGDWVDAVDERCKLSNDSVPAMALSNLPTHFLLFASCAFVTFGNMRWA